MSLTTTTTRKRRHRGPKLNAHLNVEKFEIEVPAICHIPGYDEADGDFEWDIYFSEISKGKVRGRPERLPGAAKNDEPPWRLRGEQALYHSLYIHKQFGREFLKLDGVGAVDVGFSVDEARREFENLPAMRIHVGEKRSPALLTKQGRPDLTSLEYFLVSYAGLYVSQLLDDYEGAELKRRIYLPKHWETLKYFFPADVAPKTPSRTNFKDTLIALAREPNLSKYRYPVLGVRFGDLGCYLPQRHLGPPTAEKTDPILRLTLCGVPLDVLGAAYRPTADPCTGVFVDKRGATSELSDAEQWHSGRCRINPLVGGVSVGGATNKTGTLGAIVWDRTDGAPCMLGNWHVLAGDPNVIQGQPCFQPARFDGGTPEDAVASIKRWIFDDRGDAALAELNGSRHYVSSEVLGMWRPLAGTTKPRLNMEIRKWGRSSGFTEGFIDGVQLIVDMKYQGGDTRRFEDQIHIAPLYLGEAVSQPGDSGALVVMSYASEDLHQRLSRLEALLCQACEALIASERESQRTGTAACTKFASRLRDRYKILTNDDEKKASKKKDEDEKKPIDWAELIRFALEEPTEEAADSEKPKVLQDLADCLGEPECRRQLLELFESVGLKVHEAIEKKRDEESRESMRTYLAVGLLFGGDTPGSPLGEFALASDIQILEKALDFSLRPVFAPQQSFRRLEPDGRAGGPVMTPQPTTANSGPSLQPTSLGGDDRGSGPQPDSERTGTGGGGGGSLP